MEEDKPLYVIPKESDYLAMKADWTEKDGKIIDVLMKNYDSDFSTIEDGKVFALKDNNNEMAEYAMLPLGLSTLKMECYPLTSLMSYWWGENIEKFEFKVLGISTEPEVHFTFNVYNVYELGTTGTIFWLWIWINFSAVMLILVFRMIRLGCKRKTQMTRMDGFRKMSIAESARNPLSAYQQELEASTIPTTGGKRESITDARNKVELSEQKHAEFEGDAGTK